MNINEKGRGSLAIGWSTNREITRGKDDEHDDMKEVSWCYY